ncbi:GNAT family N-acetyltransferase [Streptomyces candidus]|uniref:Diamine N-acetyltransferase n=1 Tax=Streptomyces candidus TaxID=67283 RepID=A0A7X0HFZ7_9ACTN|nr:GNAT family N-acetyltransferase [Streptomyces candidus]MBB6436758.1 diamine N-acetyltransferase [Streptomyces candidus]GHH51289.1 N-acetyltransferase [Streptomyces candidus]
MTTALRLAEITPDTLTGALGIEVAAEQAHLVAPVVKSLAEAYVHQEQAWPRLVLDGDRPVAFLMAFFDVDFAGAEAGGDATDDEGSVGGGAAGVSVDSVGRAGDGPAGAVPDLRSGLWRLNVAAGEQGRGCGRFAVEAVAAEIRRRGGTRLTATWHPGEDGPQGFYQRLGFRLTGETSEDEVVGELGLAQYG